jgi:hypothetical protein
MTIQRWYATYIVSFFCGAFTGILVPGLRVDSARDSGKWFLPLAIWEVTYGRWLSLFALFCLSIAAYRRRGKAHPREWIIYFFMGFFVSRLLYHS